MPVDSLCSNKITNSKPKHISFPKNSLTRVHHSSFDPLFPHDLPTSPHSPSPSPPRVRKFPFCPRRKAQGSHPRRVGRRVRRRGGRRVARMGQETRTLFPSLRYLQARSLADPAGDDEAPRRTRDRIRQAPVRDSPDSGEDIVVIFVETIIPCPTLHLLNFIFFNFS